MLTAEKSGLLGQTCYLSQNSTLNLRRSIYVSFSHVLAEFCPLDKLHTSVSYGVIPHLRLLALVWFQLQSGFVFDCITMLARIPNLNRCIIASGGNTCAIR